MLQNTKNKARQQATFLLSTLAASMMLVQQGHTATSAIPAVGSAIKNTAYATYISLDGSEQKMEKSRRIDELVSWRDQTFATGAEVRQRDVTAEI